MFFPRKTCSRQNESLCSTFVPEKNLAPTNRFNNIFKIFVFMISTKSYQKIKILLAAPFYTHLLTIAKSQKFTSFKITSFSKQTVSLERCRKNQFWHSHAAWESFFFLIPTQRGSAKNNFCNTSPARMRFFHFFDTSPAGSSKIMKMLFLNHLVGVTSPKTRSANRYQNHLYRARTFYLLIFQIHQNLIIMFKMYYNFQ